MRDAIARALIWVLAHLPWARRPEPACHSAASPSDQPEPATSAPRYLLPPLAEPAGVPLFSDDVRPIVPLYMRAWVETEQERERERQRQRCVALVAADMGYHYPNPERHDEYGAVCA
ncbi:hypothetical protein [Streptomyces sp. NRRL B-1347]|uniref:hypothetical protein n=1 Tax=Streptomyces sp. NRRL B-1347 TaxID=1476877 RepID=UPI0004C84904|nr:hypothetical protein [Streptomyces sp. NRRL B-1347]